MCLTTPALYLPGWNPTTRCVVKVSGEVYKGNPHTILCLPASHVTHYHFKAHSEALLSLVSSTHTTGPCNLCPGVLLFIDYRSLVSSCVSEIGYFSSLESALLTAMFPEPRGCWHMAGALKP